MTKLGNIGVPDEVYAQLEARAKLHERDIASEVRIILRDALGSDPSPAPAGQRVVKIIHPCPVCEEPVKIMHAHLWRCPNGHEGDNPDTLSTDRREVVEALA